MKKRIKLCLTMALRDYPAFEDLATELGVCIEDIEIVNSEKRAPVIRRVRITAELKESVLKYPNSMQHTAVRSQLIKKLGVENVPSANSIAKIRFEAKLKKEKEV